MNSFKDLEEKYKIMKKQNPGLPDFELLDINFDLDGATLNVCSEINKPLRFIRKAMINFYNYATNYLHDFIYPNRQSAILMEEYKSLSDEKRDEIITIIPC